MFFDDKFLNKEKEVQLSLKLNIHIQTAAIFLNTYAEYFLILNRTFGLIKTTSKIRFYQCFAVCIPLFKK